MRVDESYVELGILFKDGNPSDMEYLTISEEISRIFPNSEPVSQEETLLTPYGWTLGRTGGYLEAVGRMSKEYPEHTFAVKDTDNTGVAYITIKDGRFIMDTVPVRGYRYPSDEEWEHAETIR